MITDKDGNPVTSDEPSKDEVKTDSLSADKKLEATLAWGHINFESDKGITQSNVKAFAFATVHEMNEWFEKNPGHFAVQVMGVRDYIVCLINKVLSSEEQQLLEDRADAIAKIMEEKRLAREEAEKLTEEGQAKARAEVDRLMNLGRKCEHNHGAVLKEIDKFKKEVKELRKKAGK
jgi:hypothetical protein